MATYPLYTWRKAVPNPALTITDENQGYRVRCAECPEMDVWQPTYGLAEIEGHNYVMDYRKRLEQGLIPEAGVVTSVQQLAEVAEDPMAAANGKLARMEGETVPDPEELFDATAPVAPRKGKKK